MAVMSCASWYSITLFHSHFGNILDVLLRKWTVKI